MKGFIEVTNSQGYKELLNINHIHNVYMNCWNSNGCITTLVYAPGSSIDVQETYEDVKRLIAQSMY